MCSKKQSIVNLTEIAELSPFEIKDVLIKIAKLKEDHILNAGRGNPNFLATTPRHAYHQFGLFALSESERSFKYMNEALGGMTKQEGIEARFELFCSRNHGIHGISFLEGAISYVRDQMDLNASDFLYELSEAVLGNNYPSPSRSLAICEKINSQYIRREIFGNYPYTGSFDLFPTEGGAAAITYLFSSLKNNYLLNEGDTIALGTPIFQPYIEIPHLKEFNLKSIFIHALSKNNWQFTHEELDKLRDPKVKMFFLINPSNPPSVCISNDVLSYIVDIIKERPDLMILTDDVYATFIPNFVSLIACCPYNTMLVYSYSKFFGATGWRLGSIAIDQKNIFDSKIAALPEKQKEKLYLRYSSISINPDQLKFIDRVVADSRSVALNHTAGLSTPAQVQMTLFSLFSLIDETENYKKALQRVLARRMKTLYDNLSVNLNPNILLNANYYTLFDLDRVNKILHGEDYVKWRHANIQPNEIEYRLASDFGVVLLPGAGFGSIESSTRVSLANLNENDYAKIGIAMRKLNEEFYQRYLDDKKNGEWK